MARKTVKAEWLKQKVNQYLRTRGSTTLPGWKVDMISGTLMGSPKAMKSIWATKRGGTTTD